MNLTPAQRDFIGEYHRYNSTLEPSLISQMAKDSGFTYDHFVRLWSLYLDSWSGDFSTWGGDMFPPQCPPLVQFPFTSEELSQILELPLGGPSHETNP